MMVVTNNPLVRERLPEEMNLLWVDGGYEDVIVAVRNRVHRGHRLLTHPLAGSVKPYETPYRTIFLSDEATDLHHPSLSVLEQAMALLNAFKGKTGGLNSLRTYRDEHLPDLQLVDYGLVETVIQQQPTMHQTLDQLLQEE
ncbi:GrdX family protein [Anoxynatronum sibiricum]|uniref:GrdX family protein n=1 Tax=Anoxynatronum sibiricum TaxID=210623 RepID=A0ABU9VUN2_9CLOT